MEKTSSFLRFAKHPNRGIFSAILGGFITWVIFALSFLTLIALIAYKNADPTRLIEPLSYTSLCISAFVFGFTSGRLRGKQGALVGAMSGAILTALVFIFSHVLKGESAETPLGMAIVLYAAVIALATIGGLFAHKKPNHKRKRRKR